MDFIKGTSDFVKRKILDTVVSPIDSMFSDSITDISTTIGSFVLRNIRGKFARSISFQIGSNWNDFWMEDALYAILYAYNDIKKKSNLSLINAAGQDDGSSLYYRLGDGTHSLKYRNYDIILVIQNAGTEVVSRRSYPRKNYTIFTYNLDQSFVVKFEKDMLTNRNALLKIRNNAPSVNVYKDLHEPDGTTYWEKSGMINKRKMNTLYLPIETKRTIIDTINGFFASKAKYRKMGIPHNLKILLYGGHGYGKDTVARVIASEYNRNIYYVTGGKNGYFIPEAIADNSDIVREPLFIVSDIDKYPFLINDTDIVLDSKSNVTAEKVNYKLLFGKMINALDGILTGEGRIIIMTTNHIEKFSPVFTRPGRVDLLLEIKAVTPSVFRKYTFDTFGLELPENIKLKTDNLSVADLHFDTLFLKTTPMEFVKKYIK